MYFSLPNGEIELSNYQIKKLSEKSPLSTSNFRTYIIFYVLKRVHWIGEHAKPTICWNDVSHCWLMDHIGLSLVFSSSLFPLLLMCLKKLIICTFRLKWQSHIQDFFGRLVFLKFSQIMYHQGWSQLRFFTGWDWGGAILQFTNVFDQNEKRRQYK